MARGAKACWRPRPFIFIYGGRPWYLCLTGPADILSVFTIGPVGMPSIPPPWHCLSGTALAALHHLNSSQHCPLPFLVGERKKGHKIMLCLFSSLHCVFLPNHGIFRSIVRSHV